MPRFFSNLVSKVPVDTPDQLVAHLFRRESAKMIAVLTRAFGFSEVETAEDIVSETMQAALESWRVQGLPQNPEGWLYRVAKNKALDRVRRSQRFPEMRETGVSEDFWGKAGGTAAETLFEGSQIADSQLRMMFGCCHPELPEEYQLVLILKYLCGMGVQEIAHALLTSYANIEKRLYRTRVLIREKNIDLEWPGDLRARLEGVLHALYLLFSEGYYSLNPSMNAEYILRMDLCEDAMRLLMLLMQHPETRQPRVEALMALMCFHAARLDARQDAAGGLVRLEDQDRTQWEPALINLGLDYLGYSARGDAASSYHLEAAIVAYYVTTPAAQPIPWEKIRYLYDQLVLLNPNPVVKMNRALVVFREKGPEAGLAALQEIGVLASNPLYHLAHAEMYRGAEKDQLAREAGNEALTLARTPGERAMIGRYLGGMGLD